MLDKRNVGRNSGFRSNHGQGRANCGVRLVGLYEHESQHADDSY
jgi:hypothetical protein